MNILTKILIGALLGAASIGGPANAFPNSECALVVASRQTPAEIATYMAENSQRGYRAVYKSENGWYALVLDFIPSSSSDVIISRLASASTIPPDSYCSNGKRYVELYWSSESPVSQPAPVTRVEPEAAKQAPALRKSSSGSAFYVTGSGVAMTNYHVIEGCKYIEVAGSRATLIGSSDTFDLALIQTNSTHEATSYLKFSDAPSRLNSDITVAGFPLSQTLGGFNITRGTVSSLEGIHNDSITMQISAPIQPGSSGGPVVDRNGNVVGVVVSKLSDAYALGQLDTIPQNVNFAVRGEIVKVFAGIQNVGLEVVSASSPLDPEDLGDQLRDATVLVDCFQ